MREVARELAYDPAYLLNRFPDLCKRISARHQVHRSGMSIQRRQRVHRQIREATTTIHEQGLYPSQQRVSALIDSPCSMREPGAGEVWHETLAELGWE
jgi:hypothetical protein